SLKQVTADFTPHVAPLAIVVALSLLMACGPGGGGDPGGGSGRPGVHMAELSLDLTKVYLSSTDKKVITVVDARSLGADTSDDARRNRAYVVSKESDELAVIDLRTLEMVQHASYDVLRRVPVGKEPTHMSVSRDGNLLAVMNEQEGSGAVSFLDTAQDIE